MSFVERSRGLVRRAWPCGGAGGGYAPQICALSPSCALGVAETRWPSMVATTVADALWGTGRAQRQTEAIDVRFPPPFREMRHFPPWFSFLRVLRRGYPQFEWGDCFARVSLRILRHDANWTGARLESHLTHGGVSWMMGNGRRCGRRSLNDPDGRWARSRWMRECHTPECGRRRRRWGYRASATG